MNVIGDYFYQVIDILFNNSPILIGLLILLVIFILILLVNQPVLNRLSIWIFVFIIVAIFFYLLADSNLILITKGKISLTPPRCEQSKSTERFIIKVNKCSKHNSNVNLELLVINKGKPRDFYLSANNTRLFDWSGNENNAQRVSLGNSNYKSSSRTKIPYNIPIKASISFQDVLLKKDTVSLLEIETNYGNVKFHNILLYN